MSMRFGRTTSVPSSSCLLWSSYPKGGLFLINCHACKSFTFKASHASSSVCANAHTIPALQSLNTSSHTYRASSGCFVFMPQFLPFGFQIIAIITHSHTAMQMNDSIRVVSGSFISHFKIEAGRLFRHTMAGANNTEDLQCDMHCRISNHYSLPSGKLLHADRSRHDLRQVRVTADQRVCHFRDDNGHGRQAVNEVAQQLLVR